MLRELIESDFGQAEDYNCAEKIIYGANKAYDLKLTPESLKLAAGFGGGMGVGTVCGALSAGVMVLSHMFVKDHAHESKLIKTLSLELFSSYRRAMGEVDCGPLKAKYRTPETQCKTVIIAAAQALDDIIAKHRSEII